MSIPNTARTIQRPGASLHSLLAAMFEQVISDLDSETRQKLIDAISGHRRHCRKPVREMSIAQLCKAYCAFADRYYRRSDGIQMGESDTIRYALRPLRSMFARTPVVDFGPRRLKQVRENMIERGWCRKHVNQQIGRIKRMFKWAVSDELIPSNTFHAIQSVAGLQPGRSAARESRPIKPAPQHLIDAVFPFVSSQVQAMIKLQLFTGMRPGEVLMMRTCDLDLKEQPWTYTPFHHKTEHHGHDRIIFLGPKAQEVILPFLNERKPDQALFSPARAERERRRRLHALRKTPLSCGNVPGSHRKRHPKRTVGDRYNTLTYARAISRALEQAFPAPAGLGNEQIEQWRHEHHWHPHQLRHNAATWLRKEFGIDVAQVVLGHKTLSVTQVYAEKDVKSAQRVMLQVG